MSEKGGAVAMRTPKTGRGKLRTGNPGNRGGTGAPPSELRARLRGSLEERVATVEEIADNPECSPADRLRAIDLLAKYGLGTQKEITVEHVRGKLQETIAIIRQTLPEPQAAQLLDRLREVWR